MKYLVLVGACYLDTILTVPHFPSEDTKLRATSLTTRRGGNVPNTLEVLTQLAPSLQTHLITVLPSRSSPATTQILSSFSHSPPPDDPSPGTPHRIGTPNFSHCLYREAHTSPASSYIIRSSATGSRTIVNHNALEEMTTREFVHAADGILDGIEHKGDGVWWHFEGRIPETTLSCVRHVRRVAPASIVSVEVEKPLRDGLRELAAEADVVFYSRSWAESQGYANAEACLRGEAASSKASLLLCTWGSHGASAFSPSTNTCTTHAPSSDDIKVVDTIGAGDTFIAGMLYSLICHTPQAAKLRFAVELATAKVQREGFAGLSRSLDLEL
ncbi:Ribokinase-like protein [Cercophora newfieldiana]|uniref:Ribokinase-like protein n=1 Tax=Cercophora newfieldiana TaxID=92897 RepID=A0AA39XR52_9PEZI|nr:Ribokinase-like protein [Cercophora newfieldiana]